MDLKGLLGDEIRCQKVKVVVGTEVTFAPVGVLQASKFDNEFTKPFEIAIKFRESA